MLPSWFAWPFRIIIYSLAVVVSFQVLMPHLPEGTVGIVMTAPLAALAFGLDVLMTSKLRKTSVETEVTRRIIIADSVFSKDPFQIGRKPESDQLDAGDETVLIETDKPENSRPEIEEKTGRR